MTLVGADDRGFPAKGKFVGRLSRDDDVVDEHIFVISGQPISLLSRRVCETLDQVLRVAVDSVEAADVHRQDNPQNFVCRAKRRL